MNGLRENLDVVLLFAIIALLILALLVGCLLSDYWAHIERMHMLRCGAWHAAEQLLGSSA